MRPPWAWNVRHIRKGRCIRTVSAPAVATGYYYGEGGAERETEAEGPVHSLPEIPPGMARSSEPGKGRAVLYALHGGKSGAVRYGRHEKTERSGNRASFCRRQRGNPHRICPGCRTDSYGERGDRRGDGSGRDGRGRAAHLSTACCRPAWGVRRAGKGKRRSVRSAPGESGAVIRQTQRRQSYPEIGHSSADGKGDPLKSRGSPCRDRIPCDVNISEK